MTRETSYARIRLTYKLSEARMGGKECGAPGFPSCHQRWVPHSTLLAAVCAPATAQAHRRETPPNKCLGKLRLYCYSRKMGSFISAPSAQAHLLLPRQPARTQQVCSSPPLGVLSSRGCSGTRVLIPLPLSAVSRRDARRGLQVDAATSGSGPRGGA